MTAALPAAYEIRLAQADDLRVLPNVELRAVQVFHSWLSETGMTPALINDVSDVEELEAARSAGHLWVATFNGEIVGFAQCAILDQMLHLDEIDVVPEHMGKGVGSALLSTVIGHARSNAYPAVTLSTFRHVPWNQPFYERRGFQPAPETARLPDHGALVAAEAARGLKVDLRVIMELRLTS